MKKTLLFSSAVILLFVFCLSGNAQVAKFQSKYLYNICRYVEWPADFGGDNIVIGVVGNNAELMRELRMIAASKTIQNKRIAVKQIISAGESASCNVLFFTQGDEKRLAEYHPTAKNALLVTETGGAMAKRAAINFFLEGSKLKFEVKKANARRKGLKISNNLLHIAASTY